MKRAVLVICDGLRADMVRPDYTPKICRLGLRSTTFLRHRGVFPSTTRTTSASIATGCYPARHGLEGNCVALDEGNGLVALSVGPPAFRDRLERATGQTLKVPTLAERLENKGGSVVFSNVSPGAGIFQDPDGHGWMYHRCLGYGPGRKAVSPSDALDITHDAAGDDAMTTRFIDDVLAVRRPALAVLWQCEPDHSQHSNALGSPAHLESIAAADRNAGRVADYLSTLSDADETLLIVASDHGHETVSELVDVEALLLDAGFKNAPGSSDVVVTSNGFSASIYMDDSVRWRLCAITELLGRDARIGQVISGPGLRDVGHRVDSALALVVVGAGSEQVNPFGVPGSVVAFSDPLSGDSLVGCGQHGGLGRYEQNPFLVIHGGGFTAGSRRETGSSAVDLAPTVLTHLGLDVSGMDGSALQ
jgi:arylsulfatase A-like enzyme